MTSTAAMGTEPRRHRAGNDDSIGRAMNATNDSRLPPPNCHLKERRLNRKAAEGAKAGKYTEMYARDSLDSLSMIVVGGCGMPEPKHQGFLRVFLILAFSAASWRFIYLFGRHITRLAAV
jgi:hypothetical protein